MIGQREDDSLTTISPGRGEDRGVQEEFKGGVVRGKDLYGDGTPKHSRCKIARTERLQAFMIDTM